MAELRRCSEQRSRLLGLAMKAPSAAREPDGEAATVVWKESKLYGTQPDGE